ncbi:MAG: PKD domain-containing protein [Bacteroidota bacterium]
MLRLLCYCFLFCFGFLANAQVFNGFVLYNADTDQSLGSLTDGQTIDLTEVGPNLNVVVAVNPRVRNVGSVRFALNGNDNFRTESVAPYALAGDDNGDFLAWSPAAGGYTLTATAFTEANGGGDELTSLTVSFTVVAAPREVTPPTDPGTGEITLAGELKKWHKLTLSADGPAYAEDTDTINPFLDYRLEVTFTQGERSFVIPGYFAADGNAAETGAESGNVWRTHFAPDAAGEWSYTVSFRLGGEIAVSDAPMVGQPLPPLDGQTGTFTVAATDKVAPDNRARGRLQYVGEHYLRWAETGEYFLKGGADAPENFLAYEDFDNTPNNGDWRKNWAPHADDHRPGDPSWRDSLGTEIIGAVNYLAEKGLNVFSFLTMNIGGDDKNVFPYRSETEFTQFDCSKLDQWEILFAHAGTRGMYLHFKTQETENDQLLDGGALGVQRRLYYRELVARFGHHLALNWNLGEENTQTPDERKAMAQWFADHDPYGHHRVLHTFPNQIEQVYAGLLGDQSAYTGPSIQTNWNNVHAETKKWIDRSVAAGKPWVVANDEQGSANVGVPPDLGWPGYDGRSPNMNAIRREVLWGNLMAGGAGVEYYFGYQVPESDLSLQNFRSRDVTWDYVRHALGFFRGLDFPSMASADDLVSGNDNWCFADQGREYAIYLKNGGTANLQLIGSQPYAVTWFNPRTGESTEGTPLSGPGSIALGTPPGEMNEDWAIRLYRTAAANQPPTASFTVSAEELMVTFDASASTDTDGNIVSYAWDFGDGNQATGASVAHTYAFNGTYPVRLIVTDEDGGASLAEQAVMLDVRGLCGEEVTMFSRDFPFDGTQFYLDDFIGQDILAINPETGETAEVAQAFTGESCFYDITFHGLGENDGRSSFKLFVDGKLAGDIVLPLSTEPWELGEAYNVTFPGIPVRNGAEIKVFGKVGTDGQEFSRARWLKIDFRPAGGGDDCTQKIWGEEDGIVVIEMEHGNLSSSWRQRTTTGGFTGDGYIQWEGAEFFNQVGVGKLIYPVRIEEAGTYRFIWHTGIGRGTSNTEHNDTWVRFNGAGAQIFARKTGAQYLPRPACESNPDFGCPEGSSRGNFLKIYNNNGNFNGWRWWANTSDNDATPVFVEFTEPGLYEMELNARSSFNRLDRTILYRTDVADNVAQRLSRPETLCRDGENYDLGFTVSDGFTLLEDATITIGDVSLATDAAGKASFNGLATGWINYTVTRPGYFQVSGALTLGENRTELVTLEINTSLRGAAEQLPFHLYPNPAAREVILELPTTETTAVRIFDVAGRLLQSRQSNGLRQRLSLYGLASGSYWVEVRTRERMGKQLLIVR